MKKKTKLWERIFMLKKDCKKNYIKTKKNSFFNSSYGVGPLAILPQYQSYGIGRKLMEEVVKKSLEDEKKLVLTVNCHNVIPLSLYTKLGFQVKASLALMTGRIKNYKGTNKKNSL